MNDDRHIWISMPDGTEWLRDPRFDSEIRLKDLDPDQADAYRRELPIRHEGLAPNYVPAIVHVFPESIEFDGSEDDDGSRWLAPLQVHVHHPNGGSAVMMVHLQGLAVHQDDDGIQQVDDPEYAEDLDLLTQLYEPDHPYHTVLMFNGREYTIYGVPYC